MRILLLLLLASPVWAVTATAPQGGRGAMPYGITLSDEGTVKGVVKELNFIGSGVTCVVAPPLLRGDCTISGGGGGSSAFNDITSGTNTTAAMHCGAGCTLDSTGGIISASLAQTLASNPADCGANNYATTIAANGDLTCAQVNFNQLAGTATDAQIPDTITVNLAATATALAADPTDCGANNYATTIAASGNLTCAQVNFNQLAGTATDAQIPDTITLTNITQIGTRSHSSLQNLNADDHTQYLLLAGRAGGQSANGGTAGTDTLTFKANTSDTLNLVFNASEQAILTAATPAGTALAGLGLDLSGTTTASGVYVLKLLPAGATMNSGSVIEPIRFDSTMTMSSTGGGTGAGVVTVGDVPFFANSGSLTGGSYIGKTARPTFTVANATTWTGVSIIGEFFTPQLARVGTGTGTVTAMTALFHQPGLGSNIGDGWTIADTRAVRCDDTVDTLSSSVTNQGCIDIGSLANGTTLNYSLRSAGSQFMLHEGNVIIGSSSTQPTQKLEVVSAAAASHAVQIDLSATLTGQGRGINFFTDGVTIGSNGILTAIDSTATATVNNSPGTIFTALLFSDTMTFQNDSGNARTTTGYGSFVSTPTFKANNAALTMNNGSLNFPATGSFITIPTWTRAGTPTQTVAEYTAFGHENGVLGGVGAGWTITNYRGFHFEAPPNSGTVTNMLGLDIEAPNGTNNISARIAATVGNEVMNLTSVATNDDPTERTLQCRVATTDATVTTCGTTYAVATSHAIRLEATVVAHCTGGASCTANQSAGYTIFATCRNNGGTTATATGGPTQTAVHEDTAGWDATIDCDDTTDTARLRVTGAGTTNITWHATIRSMDVNT